jgi:hypothetical protein
MTTLSHTFKIGGVLTDMDSVVIEDATGLIGLVRTDTGAEVVAPGTALTKASKGTYTYTFVDPTYNLDYTYTLKVTYGGKVFYSAETIDGDTIGIDVDTPDDSDAYVTEAEQVAYFKTRVDSTAFDNATATERAAARVEATRIINSLNYMGIKTSSSQSNEFPRNDDTSVPEGIKTACHEIVFAILDGVDVEIEYDNLGMISQGYANVRTTYDQERIPEHILAGVPSVTAWRYLKPYLVDPNNLKLSRVS